VEGFYLELIRKFLSYQDVKVETTIKTRQASHGLIMTYQKGHWKNDVHKEEGEKELTLLDRWICANAKNDPEAPTKSSLSDCTWLEK
jgi:hypothetical protein